MFTRGRPAPASRAFRSTTPAAPSSLETARRYEHQERPEEAEFHRYACDFEAAAAAAERGERVADAGHDPVELLLAYEDACDGRYAAGPSAGSSSASSFSSSSLSGPFSSLSASASASASSFSASASSFSASAFASASASSSSSSASFRDERNTWSLLRQLHTLRASGWDERDGAAGGGGEHGGDGDREGDGPLASGSAARRENENAYDCHVTNVGWGAQEAVGELVRTDPLVRLLLCVKDWLEKRVCDEPMDVIRGGGREKPWPATLSLLGRGGAGGGIGGGGRRGGGSGAANHSLVSSLDPDAPSREGRVGKFMESDDIAREAAFLEGVWRLVRAGELAKAKQLCVIHGQPWRAAILAGGGLCHSVPYVVDDLAGDPEDDMAGEDGVGGGGAAFDEPAPATARVGNPMWFAWKRMCWHLADRADPVQVSAGPGASKSISAADRAIHAGLCGNLEALLASPLCAHWEDHLWAYVCSMIEFLVDRRLQRQRICLNKRSRVVPGPEALRYADEILSKSSILRAMCGPRGSVDDDAGINQDQGDFQTVVEGIFKGLRVSTTLAVSEAAQTPFRCAQAALIEGSGSLIGFIRTFKDKYLPACSPQLLRFGAHLVLYMKGCVKTLGWEEMQAPEEAEDDILEAYTVHLISQRQANIIPYYAQHLPRSRRIDLYSKFLQTVEKKDERTKCLEEATRFFAEDIPDILQTTAQLSREHPPEVIGQRIDLDPSKVPEELSRRGVSLADYHRVAGVHWLCMDGAHRFQATKEANALARSLLLDRQVVHSEMEGQDDNGSRGKLAAAEALLVGLEHSHDAHQGHGLHPLGLSDPEEPILPPDTADVLKGILKTSEEDDPKRDDLENALKEYTGWCDLLYAYQAYKKWRIALSESGTAQWEAQSASAHESKAKADIVAMGNFVKRAQAGDQQSRRIADSLDRAVEAIRRVIECEEKWMIDTPNEGGDAQDDDDEARDDRRRHLAVARRTWLPRMVSMLHEVFVQTANYYHLECGDPAVAVQYYKRAMKVCDTVASEQHELYREFQREDMERFLRRIHDTTARLLRLQKHD